MFPLLRGGDVVTIGPVGRGPLPIGAVVAAEVPGSGGLVVHRLVGRRGPNVLLRGDNGARADGEVPETAVIGVVVSVTRDRRPVAPVPTALRRPFAALVRAGVVRRVNLLRRLVGKWVPRRMRVATPGTERHAYPLIGFASETKPR